MMEGTIDDMEETVACWMGGKYVTLEHSFILCIYALLPSRALILLICILQQLLLLTPLCTAEYVQ